MYKRKPRVLFSCLERKLAEQAVVLLRQLGDAWAEGRSCGSLSSVSRDSLDWADLLVVLDRQLPAEVATISSTRVRHWPLPAGDDHARVDELNRRIRGMLGGIRMFAASDGL